MRNCSNRKLVFLKHFNKSFHRTWCVLSLINFSHRTVGDKLGEAKASGNLGNTLKVLGKFDEAIACCQRHLDLSKEITDRVSRSDGWFVAVDITFVLLRMLSPFGNVVHMDSYLLPTGGITQSIW